MLSEMVSPLQMQKAPYQISVKTHKIAHPKEKQQVTMIDTSSDKEESVASSAPPVLPEDSDTVDSKSSIYKYRDFSKISEDDEDPVEVQPQAPSSRGSTETSIRVQKFPVKLYAILAQKEFHDVIAWMPHGRSWKVLKPSLFESLVMPLFFEYSNYHSFNRLVNAWSFRRVSSGVDRGSYYHELFLRGKPHLQKYMRRLPKTHKKLPMDKGDEPNFNFLNKVNPLPRIEDAPVPAGAAARAMANRSMQQQQHNHQYQHTLSQHPVHPPHLVTPSGNPNTASPRGHVPNGYSTVGYPPEYVGSHEEFDTTPMGFRNDYTGMPQASPGYLRPMHSLLAQQHYQHRQQHQQQQHQQQQQQHQQQYMMAQQQEMEHMLPGPPAGQHPRSLQVQQQQQDFYHYHQQMKIQQQEQQQQQQMQMQPTMYDRPIGSDTPSPPMQEEYGMPVMMQPARPMV